MTATLLTRRLGRTERHVTTLGLGGQASIQWPASGVDPVAIIDKAVRLGVSYLDTSNVYGASQLHFGAAFRRLGLTPGTGNYDARAREHIYVATKTHVRTARHPEGQPFPSDFSDGMRDHFQVQSAVDDVRRSLSQLFGDGQGQYPADAYLDCIQFHNLNTLGEVDMLFEGADDPRPDRPWLGALAAMIDLRDGENRTGLNPKREKLVRHIGITGHWNTAAHVYAIQRDSRRVLDTLLVTVNPTDRRFMAHEHNAVAVAHAADMGVIAMKVFADAAYYHKPARFSGKPDDVYQEVGSPELPSDDLIQYALSVPGVSTAITGIGHINEAPARCQLTRNLAAAQLTTPWSAEQRRSLEARVEHAGKGEANAYFQRRATGLTAPRNVGAEPDSAIPAWKLVAVRVSWDMAYAGDAPVDHYEVLRDGATVGYVKHEPQIGSRRFVHTDFFADPDEDRDHLYVVRSIDAAGRTADSPAWIINPRVKA